MADEPLYDDMMSLEQYAALVNRSVDSIRRDVRMGVIPAWKDPVNPRGRVVSPKAIAALSHETAKREIDRFRQEQEAKARKGKR